MYFDNKAMEDIDFSTKGAREKSRATLKEIMENNGTARDKAAAKVLDKLLDAMDAIPEPYALVHEVVAECKQIGRKLDTRTRELSAIARQVDHGQPVHRFGQVEAYLVVAAGAVLAAGDILQKLETYISEQALQARAEDDGPLEREAPTEPPPAPTHAPEAPLG